MRRGTFRSERALFALRFDRLKHVRVLIVEDESQVSLLLQDMLQDLGHTVSGVAPSLRTALATAAGVPSDLAIVDIGLAGDGGDGVQTAVELRQRFGVPAVLMTGATVNRLDAQVRTAQAVGFLRKPYTLEDLRRALETASASLGGSRARQI